MLLRFVKQFPTIIQFIMQFISRQEKAFKVNMVRAGLQNFAEELTLQYQPVYISALGATASQLGIVSSIRGFSTAITAMVVGWLADKHGLKVVFEVATLLMTMGALLFALAQSWVMAIPALLVASLGLSISRTACPVVCGSCLRDEERATGRGLCDTLTLLPRLVSPTTAAILITVFGGLNRSGIRPLYYIQALILVAIFVLVFRAFMEPASRRILRANLGFIESIREVFAKGIAMKRWVVFDCASKIPYYVATTVYVPLFAARVKGADQFTLGAMATGLAVTPLLFSLPMGRLADMVGRKKVIYLTTSIYCSSLLLLVYAPNPTILIISAILQGFSEVASVIRGAMTAELVPPSLLGSTYGILGLFRGIVSLIAPLIGGVLWDTTGPEYVFFFVIATQLLNMLLLSTIPETLKRA